MVLHNKHILSNVYKRVFVRRSSPYNANWRLSLIIIEEMSVAPSVAPVSVPMMIAAMGTVSIITIVSPHIRGYICRRIQGHADAHVVRLRIRLAVVAIVHPGAVSDRAGVGICSGGRDLGVVRLLSSSD